MYRIYLRRKTNKNVVIYLKNKYQEPLSQVHNLKKSLSCFNASKANVEILRVSSEQETKIHQLNPAIKFMTMTGKNRGNSL